jgi:hypothetical protein
MAIGAEAPPPYAYRQPSVSGAIWRPAGAYGRQLVSYSIPKFSFELEAIVTSSSESDILTAQLLQPSRLVFLILQKPS